MSITADLRHVIYSLSYALDLVGIDDVGHGKRVGIMAAECGKTKGLSRDAVTYLFDLGMLHDLGVSSTAIHKNLVDEFDWQGSQEHCARGYELLTGFGPLADFALPIKFHHTRWDRLSEAEVDPAIAWQANLILLADRVDTFLAPYYGENSVLMHADEVREHVRQYVGTYFDPETVELFLESSGPEFFWLLLEPRSIEIYLQDILSETEERAYSDDNIQQLALMFSRIVDAKSAFTSKHSVGVASVARLLAEKMGVTPENYDKIEIAGLLHDLGKLRIPDEILDKPGELDERERKIIYTHTFETYQILRRIKGFEEIAQWASFHHEEPGRRGYPFHLNGESLPLEARIIRVADIFQAMTQNRPYRKGFTSNEVRSLMERLAADRRVDAEIIAVLNACLDTAMIAARAS